KRFQTNSIPAAFGCTVVRERDARLQPVRRHPRYRGDAAHWCLLEEAGCRQLIEGLLPRGRFAFPLERAIFAAVLHRFTVSGFDRARKRWLEAYRAEGAEPLAGRGTRRPERRQGPDRGAAVHAPQALVLRSLHCARYHFALFGAKLGRRG